MYTVTIKFGGDHETSARDQQVAALLSVALRLIARQATAIGRLNNAIEALEALLPRDKGRGLISPGITAPLLMSAEAPDLDREALDQLRLLKIAGEGLGVEIAVEER